MTEFESSPFGLMDEEQRHGSGLEETLIIRLYPDSLLQTSQKSSKPRGGNISTATSTQPAENGNSNGNNTSASKFSRPSKASGELNVLKQLSQNMQKWLETHVNGWDDYLWHVEPPLWEAVPSGGVPFGMGSEARLLCSQGHVRVVLEYGMCTGDEWWLLQGILRANRESSEFSQLSIHVADDDGPFYMLDAAACLPSWLHGASGLSVGHELRVWFRQGAMKLLPPPVTPAQLGMLLPGRLSQNGSPDVVTAVLGLLMNDLTAPMTNVSEELQSSVRERIERGAVDAVEANTHYMNAMLPHDVAAVLTIHPELIGTLLDSWAERSEKGDAKALKAPLIGAPVPVDQAAAVRLRLTRLLAARVLSEAQSSDGGTGGLKAPPGWKEVGWPLNDADKTVGSAAWLGLALSGGMAISYAAERRLGAGRLSAGVKAGKRFIEELSSSSKSLPWKNGLDGLKALGPEDDTSWMEVSDQELQELLTGSGIERAETEKGGVKELDEMAKLSLEVEESLRALDAVSRTVGGGAKAPTEADQRNLQAVRSMVSSVMDFVNDTSATEDGAEATEPTSIGSQSTGDEPFNVEQFMNVLGSVLGGPMMEPEAGDHDIDDDGAKESAVPIPAAGAAGAANKRVKEEGVVDDGSDTEPLADDGSDMNGIEAAMAAMDQELAKSQLRASGEDVHAGFNGQEDGTGGEGGGLDLDMNLVQNILASVEAEHGGSGPASNLLAQLGVTLPEPEQEGK